MRENTQTVDLSFLPAVNAGLNAVAALLLVVGLRLIRRRRIAAHRRVMLGAFAVSSLFLVCYVAHKASRGTVASRASPGRSGCTCR